MVNLHCKSGSDCRSLFPSLLFSKKGTVFLLHPGWARLHDTLSGQRCCCFSSKFTGASPLLVAKGRVLFLLLSTAALTLSNSSCSTLLACVVSSSPIPACSEDRRLADHGRKSVFQTHGSFMSTHVSTHVTRDNVCIIKFCDSSKN